MAKKGNIGRIINDRLNELDKIPSDRVWKGIEAANIAPSIVVSSPWYFYAIAATVIPFIVIVVLQFSDVEISINRKPLKNDSIENVIKKNDSQNNKPTNSIVSNDSLEIGNTLSNEYIKNKQTNDSNKTITNRQNSNQPNILVKPNTSSKNRKSEKVTLNQQNSLTVKQTNDNSKKAIANRQNSNQTNILVNQHNTSSKDKRKSEKLALPIPDNQKTPATQKPSNNIKTVITAKENHGSGNLLRNKSKDKFQVIKQNSVTPISKNTKMLSTQSDLVSVSNSYVHVSDTKSTNLSQTVKNTKNNEIKRLLSKNLPIPSIKESNLSVKNRINYHYIKESNLIAINSIDLLNKEKISLFKDRFTLSLIFAPSLRNQPYFNDEISMNLDVKLTNKLSFRTGFGYIAYGDFTYTEGNTTYDYSLLYRQIPLELKYKLLNKRIINIGINTGSSMLISDNPSYEINDAKVIDFSANLGAEIDCKIYKKIHLVIEPSIKVLLDTYETSKKPTLLNVRTGLAYHF